MSLSIVLLILYYIFNTALGLYLLFKDRGQTKIVEKVVEKVKTEIKYVKRKKPVREGGKRPGKTYYINELTGDDKNDGLKEYRAKKSMDKLLREINPQDRIFVKGLEKEKKK